MKQRSLTPFYLPPFKGWVASTARRKGHLPKIKKILTSFQKPQSPVIYIVEGRERPAALTEAAPYISQMRIRNDPMERQIQKRVPPPCPHLFRKGKNQYKLKNYRETQDSRKSLQDGNDGRFMYGARHTRVSRHFCICGADLESWVHCVVHIFYPFGPNWMEGNKGIPACPKYPPLPDLGLAGKPVPSELPYKLVPSTIYIEKTAFT